MVLDLYPISSHCCMEANFLSLTIIGITLISNLPFNQVRINQLFALRNNYWVRTFYWTSVTSGGHYGIPFR